jgi:predicted ferric reductase
LHPLLINVSKLIPEPGPNESELPELLGVIGLIALWSLVCTSIFRKFLMLKYEAWRKIHLISAVLRYAAVIHVFLIQSESRAGGFLFFLASISAVSFALAIWDKLLAPFILKSDREYLLKSTKEVAPDVFELTLEPKVQKEVFQYSPGQFAYLKIKSNEFLFESHPFTIVSDSTETTHLKFNIKALGDWTKKLSSLPESIDSEIIGPFGKFSPFLFNNKTKSLVLIAGGIGITPFISLIRSLSSLKIKLPVLLLWSCKTPKDFFFKAELDEIKSSFPELEYRFYVSDAPSNGVFTNSRITLETLTHQLKPNVSGTQILVCGPPGMMSAVIKDLLSLGFKKNSIHFEDFSYLD